MTGSPPAPRRRYHSPRRKQQAEETRSAVLDAAILLFATDGWTRTGMRDVAREAGVSVETVYSHFRSKGDLLMAAIDVSVVGDLESAPLGERGEFAAIGQGTLEERARAAARLVAEVNERTVGVILALREAAASDPDAAQKLLDGERRRHADIERGAGLVAGRTIDVEEADGLWAVTGVEVYRLLIDLRGWSPRRYETWLADAFVRLLEPPPSAD